MINIKNITLGMILGSGVDVEDGIITDKEVFFEERKGVHHKQVYSCKISGIHAVIFKGRKHYYEGYPPEELTSNIKLAVELGVKNLLITNAAGGINENFEEGELMLINSHINFIDKLKLNPVIFSYNAELKEKFAKACSSAKVKLHTGTYGCYSGPTYETKAEIRFQKKIGLDAAGMSTVPEVNQANYHGIKVIAVSIITNLLKENAISMTAHDDVLTTAKIASSSLNKVIPAFISQLN